MTEPTMPSAPTRIVLVGFGVIGAVHARLVRSLGDQAELVAVVDADEGRRREADRLGVATHATAAEAYAAQELDLAAICLPSGQHAEAAIAAMEAGLDVIVEKPIDIGLAAVDRLIEVERRTGRTVSVISQRRFQPAAAFLRSATTTGLLGRPTSAVVESAFFRPQSYYESGDWRGTMAMDGGGALMNQGIHALDLMLWLLGEPVWVSARTGQLAHQGIEVEDVAGATIEFASGAIGLLLASTAAHPGRPVRLALHGDGGSAVMEDDALTFFSSLSGTNPPDLDVDPPPGWSEVDVAHREQYLDVLAAIAERRAPAVTTADGRRALEVVLAVYESARSGSAVRLGDAGRRR